MNTSKYRFWAFRAGTLMVEQYIGEATSQEIIDNDKEMLKNAPSGGKLLLLSDIGQARFPDIPNTDIPSLFGPYQASSDKAHDMRVALYTGSNEWTDFDKANEYAKEGAIHSMNIVPFNRLESAMNWLGLTEKEKKEITSLLNS